MEKLKQGTVVQFVKDGLTVTGKISGIAQLDVQSFGKNYIIELLNIPDGYEYTHICEYESKLIVINE